MNEVFRNLTVLTRWLRGLLLASAAVGVLSLVADVYENTVEGGARDTLDTIQGFIGGAQAIAALATFIVAGVWIYRSACNVRAFGARDLQTSPGWAVGWYFIPIAGLFKPYQAMSEMWRASANPVGWREATVPWLLPVWWGAWLISNFLDVQMTKLLFSNSSSNTTSPALTLASDVMDLVALFAFFAVVGGLWKLQDRSRLRTSMDEVFSGQEARDVPTRQG